MREPLLPRSHEQIAADNRAEIDGWIDERAAELCASGIDPTEARRRAVSEFGDVIAAQRYAVSQDVAGERRVRIELWIEEFGSDLRIGCRSLWRAPTVAGVVLLTFALGIGAATAVFSVVHAMLLRPLPYDSEDTLVQLQPVEKGVIDAVARYSATALVQLRERTTSFAGIAGIEGGSIVITESGDPEQVMLAAVTANAFDVLGANAALGRTFSVADETGSSTGVVLLLDGLWRRRFNADRGIVGRTIELNGGRREVVGVMPPDFRVPTYEAAELLIPRDLSPLLRNTNTSQVRFLRLFARMKPGVPAQVAQADIDQAMQQLQGEAPRSFAGLDTQVVPIRTALAGDARPRLLVLMGAAAFVLLIACANVAGILLSRALARKHELSVRVALGAGRRRLIRQFLAEGAVLAILGAALGIGVAERGIATLQQIVVSALPPGTVFALDLDVALFAIAAAVLAAFVSSIVPALAATQGVRGALGRDEGRSSPPRASRRLRLGLVAAQLGVAVVLLVGAGLFLRTFDRLSAINLGYDTAQSVTFRLPFTRPRSDQEQDAFWASLYEQLRAIPGTAFAGGGNVPLSGQSTITALEIEGRSVETSRLPEVRYAPASDDYFAALGIPLVRGRTFSDTDRDGAPAVAVISAGLGKQLWPTADPIGARIRVAPTKPWTTIVGIVGDVRMGGADSPRPSIYTSQRQDHWPGGGAVVVRAKGEPGSLAAAIRQAVKNVDPTIPIVGLRTLEEFRSTVPVIAERRLQMRLMMLFALLALVVSAIGVYGVSAYATEARRREFGIRMAIGASQRDVLWLALRDGALAAVLGAIVGVPAAVAIASGMRDLLYAVTPFDPLTVAAVLGILSLVVGAAAIAPARRAALIDPARTMRAD